MSPHIEARRFLLLEDRAVAIGAMTNTRLQRRENPIEALTNKPEAERRP